MYSPLKSNRGQIAIFLVLMFQVLFVFFAMSMNIGLVVYDKINLQNSADISVYYAAQKQSELLNQIAHINYQMRQAYKLLTFRLRVIGSVSIGVGPEARLLPHPVRVGPGFGEETQSYFERIPGRHIPGVCIGSSLWHEYKITEQNATVSLCQNLDQFSAVPPTGGSDPFGFTAGLDAFLDRVRGEIEEKCKVVGVLNWQVAASWYLAYVHEATKRKEMIDAIATNMSLPAQEMTDFIGQSVYQGARKTFTNNLTEPQRQGLSEFKLINSLSSDVTGPCNNKDYWLPTIDIYPVVTYVSMIWGGYTCTTRVVTNRGNVPPADYIGLVGGRNNGPLSSVWTSGNPVPYGVEKNPWCMPYMGVSVTTQPSKIFSPFGAPAVLKAEAYAKPFGGRVGPWYSTQWSSGNNTSSGTDKVDPLLPARSISGSRGPGDPADDLVNHSKYPGDKNGMNSRYALGVMKNFFMSIAGSNPTSMASVFALSHYNH
ncbi:MAG: Tad domain-containing protein, partial [Bdellovibrionaceae bacterium]|nr:Tad domain-containing protein [Pseudobdellovibrionaceae bacterium]